MKQFKIRKIEPIQGRVGDCIISDFKGDESAMQKYCREEKAYLDIISNVIHLSKPQSILIEVQFKQKIDSDLKAYYAEELVSFHESLMQIPFEEIVKIPISKLEHALKLVLRENIRAIIYNEHKEVLFGYINDFETLVYAPEISKDYIEKLKKSGFEIKEFDFSFEIE